MSYHKRMLFTLSKQGATEGLTKLCQKEWQTRTMLWEESFDYISLPMFLLSLTNQVLYMNIEKSDPIKSTETYQ